MSFTITITNNKLASLRDLGLLDDDKVTQLLYTAASFIPEQKVTQVKETPINLTPIEDGLLNLTNKVETLGQLTNIVERDNDSKIHNQLLTLMGKVDEMKSSSIFSKTPAIKGGSLENKIYDTIMRQMPTYEIKLVSKTGHNADIHVIDSNSRIIMIDIKNYNKNVPQKEIEKLRSDVKSNKNVIGGILLSTTGIVNKQDFDVSYDPNIVYLTNSKGEAVKAACNILFAYHNMSRQRGIVKNVTVDTKSNNDSEINDDYKAQVDNFVELLKTIKGNLIQMQVDVCKQINKLSNMIVTNESTILKCPYCTMSYKTEKGLYNHIKNKHN